MKADHVHLLRLTKDAGAGSIVGAVELEPMATSGPPLDTTGKVYHEEVIHGFKVQLEPGVMEKHPCLREALTGDLEEVCGWAVIASSIRPLGPAAWPPVQPDAL